jgi:hypothetical protein
MRLALTESVTMSSEASAGKCLCRERRADTIRFAGLPAARRATGVRITG